MTATAPPLDSSEDDPIDTKPLAAHDAELTQAQPNPTAKQDWEDDRVDKAGVDPVKHPALPAKNKVQHQWESN